MSTLENIRKRPGLVIGIIGFAIILFIITGVITNFDIFRDRDTVAKVDGTKLKYDQLMKKTNELQESYKQRGRSADNIDYGMAEQEALNGMIAETLWNKAIDNLGITVTKDEMQNLLFGENAIYYVRQLAQQYGFATPEEFYNFAYSNDPQAPMVKEVWNKMEDDLRNQLRSMKYQQLFGALAANKLDAETYYNDGARTATIAVVRQDYMTVPDDQVEVTDADVNAQYNKQKELYAIPNEERLIDYILVRPNPSQDDYTAAQQEVEAVIQGLREFPGLDAVSANVNFQTENIHAPEYAIKDNVIKGAIEDMKADPEHVKMIRFMGNEYVIGKILNDYQQVDTVRVNLAIVDSSKASVDSVAALLNAGKTAEEIGEALVNLYEDSPITLVNTGYDAYLDQFKAAPKGEYVALDINAGPLANLTTQLPEAAVLVAVQKINDPVQVYDIAKITRKVEPSSETLNMLDEQLRTYLANNPDAAKFKESAAESEYDVLTTIVDASMLNLLGLPSSGAAARWAMENKKGNVSHVFTDNTRSYMLAMAVEDIYDDYTPARNADLNAELSARARNEKKGEKLVADYAGKANDLAGYAALMNAKIDTIENVNYNQDRVRGFVPGDARLLGAIAAASKGQLVGPMATNNSVVVFEIIGEEMQPRAFSFEVDGPNFNHANGVDRMMRNLDKILLGNKKVSYNVQRFTTGE